jgi:hypothetical protein
MSAPPDVALAVPFAWTPDGIYDLRLAFASGPSPVNVTVDAGTYRVNLAKTSGSTRDFLRRLQTRIDAALATATRAETSTVAITDRGLVTITLSGAATWTFSANLAAQLGFTSTSFSSVTSAAGAELPRDLYLFAGGDSPGWKRSEPIAGSMTAAGGSFGVRSGLVTWSDEITLEFIPSDPDARTQVGEVWSPWEAGASTPPYGCERILTTALAQQCAFSRLWQTVRTSTSEAFDLVTIAPATLAAPDVKYQFPSLTTWRQWTLPLVRTSTETR